VEPLTKISQSFDEEPNGQIIVSATGRGGRSRPNSLLRLLPQFRMVIAGSQ
jgi:hypothetical protein